MWFALALLAQADAWEPAKTWVFAVGVLEWEDPGVTRFPKRDRRDAEWIELLKARGVPAGQIVFLRDAEATLDRVRKEFAGFLPRVGDTLFVYYAGHGDEEGGFLPYDGGGWSARSIVEDVDTRFKGVRALLMADCCYSGLLATEVEKRGAKRIAVLTSVVADAESTGSWAFTECLLRGFRGEVDLDGDGRTSLEELGRHVETDMPFAAEQLATWRPAFPLDLAKAVGKRASAVETEWGGAWWKSRVVAGGADALKVAYVGWDASHDEWVSPERVRSWEPRLFAPGTPVKARGRAAKVIEGRLGVHRVRYDDGGEEWVGPSRIKSPSR